MKGSLHEKVKGSSGEEGDVEGATKEERENRSPEDSTNYLSQIHESTLHESSRVGRSYKPEVYEVHLLPRDEDSCTES